MRAVVVVNGFPRSGKDTFVNFALDRLNKDERSVAYPFSSIDPVFKLFADAGIEMDRQNLTDNDRCALSEVGLVMEERFGFRVNAVLAASRRLFNNGDGNTHKILFVYMREPKLIERLHDRVGQIEEVDFITVLVRRPSEKTTVSNSSDQGVLDMKYDYVVHNDADLGALEKVAHLFVRKVVGGEFLLNATPAVLRASEMP